MNIGSEITAETLSHYGGFNNSDAYRNIRNFTENNIYENRFQFIKLQLYEETVIGWWNGNGVLWLTKSWKGY